MSDETKQPTKQSPSGEKGSAQPTKRKVGARATRRFESSKEALFQKVKEVQNAWASFHAANSKVPFQLGVELVHTLLMRADAENRKHVFDSLSFLCSSDADEETLKAYFDALDTIPPLPGIQGIQQLANASLPVSPSLTENA